LPNTEPIEILLVEDNLGDARLAEEALKDGKVHNRLCTTLKTAWRLCSSCAGSKSTLTCRRRT
jgi:hypothetical protein